MLRSRALLLAAGLVCVAEGRPVARAEAPGLCGAREEVVARLSGAYGETRRGYGLNAGRGGSVVELWASAETGSWTLILSTPEGLACLLASGGDWTPAPPARPAGDPA